MIFPNVSSMGAERTDLVCDDFIFSNNVLCVWSFPFFPKYLCGQHTVVKALPGAQSYSAPILDKNYFPASVWQRIQGCIATHLLKGLISSGAVLCCNARNTSSSLPLCRTDGNWALLWRRDTRRSQQRLGYHRQFPHDSSNGVWFPGQMLCHESLKIKLQ